MIAGIIVAIIALPLSALFLATQRYYVGGVTGGAVKVYDGVYEYEDQD